MIESEILRYGILIVGTVSISFFGAISGGTGLLFRPLLMFALGLPPALAIGTARVSYFGARAASLIQFHKRKKMNWRAGAIFAVPAMIGGLIGTYITASLSDDILTRFVGFMVLVGGLLLIVKPKIGTFKSVERVEPTIWGKIATFFSFIFSNIVAATAGGAGILSSYALITFHKETFITAAAIRSVAGLGGAVVSALGFIYLGLVQWFDVPLLMLCTAVGNWAGVHWGIKKGEKTIRILTLVVIFVVGIHMVLF